MLFLLQCCQWSCYATANRPFIVHRFNTLRPRQNGRHFPDNIFKRVFFNENVWILIIISPRFVPIGLINNIPALVQIMAWRRPGDKSLSEPMMVSLLTHICVSRPQWVNSPIRILLVVQWNIMHVNTTTLRTLSSSVWPSRGASFEVSCDCFTAINYFRTQFT